LIFFFLLLLLLRVPVVIPWINSTTPKIKKKSSNNAERVYWNIPPTDTRRPAHFVCLVCALLLRLCVRLEPNRTNEITLKGRKEARRGITYAQQWKKWINRLGLTLRAHVFFFFALVIIMQVFFLFFISLPQRTHFHFPFFYVMRGATRL
jgi:hypothetical protein